MCEDTWATLAQKAHDHLVMEDTVRERALLDSDSAREILDNDGSREAALEAAKDAGVCEPAVYVRDCAGVLSPPPPPPSPLLRAALLNSSQFPGTEFAALPPLLPSPSHCHVSSKHNE